MNVCHVRLLFLSIIALAILAAPAAASAIVDVMSWDFSIMPVGDRIGYHHLELIGYELS